MKWMPKPIEGSCTPTTVIKTIIRKHFTYISAWNKHLASAGHSQFVPVFCILYTIEIWKPAGHWDRQKTNPVGHTWNRAGEWLMTGGYFMHCLHTYWLTVSKNYYLLFWYIISIWPFCEGGIFPFSRSSIIS